MKTNALISKVNFVVCTAIAFTALSAHAQVEVEDMSAGKLSESFKKAKTERDMSERAGKILDRFAINMNSDRATVFKFFKEHADKMTEASNAAWSELFTRSTAKRSATAGEIYQADLVASTVGAFIEAEGTKTVHNLPFNEVDLAKEAKTWSTDKQENFTRILKRTAKIAETTNAPSLDAAFKTALKEEGRLDKYLEGCK